VDYPPGAGTLGDGGNPRPGSNGRAVLADQGSVEPLLTPKFERHFTGFDDQIVAVRARRDGLRELGVPSRVHGRRDFFET
jgi:hypothetical protein